VAGADDEETQVQPRRPSVLPRPREASNLPEFKSRVEGSEPPPGDVIEVTAGLPTHSGAGGRARRDSVAGLDLTQHRTIGRFELVKEIARGGMGQVFLARDHKLGRRVAIKVLLRKDPHFVQRFLVEARATARCTHENIVTIYEVGEHEGLPYLVLELLEGDTLSAVLEKKPPLRRFVEIMVAVARALQRAHADGIVHRDLKPSNIFITKFQQVKVLDFGVARLMDQEEELARASVAPDMSAHASDATFTGANDVVGTMPYMSPEQWGADKVDLQSDIWAFGIMFWRALVHAHPAGSMKPEQLRARLCDLATPLPSIGERDASLPPELVRIVDKCLAKRKAERYPTANELLEDMQLLLESMPLRMTSRGIPNPVLSSGSFPAVTTTTTQASDKIDHHRGGGWTALLLAALLGGAGAAAPYVMPAPVAESSPAPRALEAEAAKLASTIDGEIRTGRSRADAVAMTPMLRAAIETDQRTVADMTKDSELFATRTDEVLEAFQTAGAASTSLVRIPATAKALPVLAPDEIRVETDGSTLRALLATPVKTQKGVIAGVLVLGVPIDLGAIREQVAKHATSATLEGLATPIVLASGSASGQPIELTVPASTRSSVSGLRLVATIARVPVPSHKRADQIRYACLGGAGLFLLGFVVIRRSK
jgi:serine/threonine protein kinase